MEIDITRFFTECDAWEFSQSQAEGGQDAGARTWRNAMSEAAAHPILTTDAELDALRDDMRATGAWDNSEIDSWNAQRCNAMLIQSIAHNMREAGFDETETPDWAEYERLASDGQIHGNLSRSDDGKVFYYLGY